MVDWFWLPVFAMGGLFVGVLIMLGGDKREK